LHASVFTTSEKVISGSPSRETDNLIIPEIQGQGVETGTQSHISGKIGQGMGKRKAGKVYRHRLITDGKK
jgi:hypothetical protein